MTKVVTQTEIEEEVGVPKTDDKPEVVAYRVGQMEKAISQGFTKIEAKLDDMSANYATKEELKDTRTELEKDLTDTRKVLDKDIKAIRTPVFGAIGIILVTVAGAIVAQVIR